MNDENETKDKIKTRMLSKFRNTNNKHETITMMKIYHETLLRAYAFILFFIVILKHKGFTN